MWDEEDTEGENESDPGREEKGSGGQDVDISRQGDDTTRGN